VLVFPCNQFGEQEPGTDAQIKEKLTTDFNVNFPIFSKIDVIGKDAHPLFEYLQEQTAGGDIKWNFEKFLVNRQGFPVERFRSGTNPNELEKDIQQLLGA
jgi:glutathione peroxidase